MQLTACRDGPMIPLPKSILIGSSALGAIKIRYLETRRLADGSIGYYYVPPRGARRAGVLSTEPLGRDPVEAARKAQERNRQLDEWRTGTELGGTEGPAKGSIAWLIERFEDSRQFKAKRPATQKFYSTALKAFREFPLETTTLGNVPARKLTRKHVDLVYLRLQKIDPTTDEPTQLPWANAIMRSARRMFSLAVRWGEVSENPFSAMGMTGTPSRETVIPREHVDAFCATAEALGRRSLALWARLSYELCQRAGDARTLAWSRYNGHEVQVKQSKTKALVWAPLLPDLPELKAMLDATERVSPVIVIDERDSKPYTLYNLSKEFNKIRDAAGLPPEYQARDMRRAGLTEAGDAEATEDELLSLSGHRNRSSLEPYSRHTRKKAANALAKRRAHRGVNQFRRRLNE